MAIAAAVLSRELVVLLLLRFVTGLLLAWSSLTSTALVDLAIGILFATGTDCLFDYFLLVLFDDELVVSLLVVRVRNLLYLRTRILPDIKGAHIR